MSTTPLTLAHSADPDDVFMWWPLTGKLGVDGTPLPGREGRPRITSDRFTFTGVPGDIADFNRRAITDAPYDITALSARAYADVQDRYVLTACGGSFGDGYGPKVVARASDESIGCANCLKPADITVAVPGLKTTAFLTLSLLLGRHAKDNPARFVEVPFDQVIPMVASGKVNAGLVIHEGQVTFAQAGLREVVDLGRWWKQARGLPLPLGVSAIKRDLENRFGPGTLREVAGLLERSLDYAMSHRDESIDATIPFAEENARRSGTQPPTRETIERYVDMYVTDLTVDMGQSGKTALQWLLDEAADAGLSPRVRDLDVV